MSERGRWMLVTRVGRGRRLPGRRLRWFGLVAAVLLASVVVTTTTLAHAVLVSASPPPGARLPSAPATVRIVFSEPLNGSLSGITVLDSAGAAVHPRGGGIDPADARAYELSLPTLPPDRYTVAWHTVSLVDGHTRTGSYPFTVLEPDGSTPPVRTVVRPPPGGAPTVPTAALALAAWMLFGGLALLAGPILVALFVRPPPAAGRERLGRSFRVASRLGGALALAGCIGELVGAIVAAGGATAIGGLIGSVLGFWWVVRAAALAVLLAAPAEARGSNRSAIGRAILLAVALIATGATSHGAASAEPAWGLAFDLAHLAGVAGWIGIVIALALAFRALEGSDPAQAAYRAQLVRRVSIVAGMAVPLVLLSGLGSALIELASPTDLVATSYGRTLTLKLLLGGVLLAVAGLNARWLRPLAARSAVGVRRLRRTVVVEAVLGVGVIGLAAVMSVGVPARATDATRAAVAQVAADSDPASGFAGSTSVAGAAAEVTVTPATLGSNVVRVETARDLGGALRLDAIDPAGHAWGAPLEWMGTETQPDGSVRTVYGGTANLPGPEGRWQLLLAQPGRSPDGAPLLVPLSKASGAGASTSSSAPPAGPAIAWLALLALATVGAVIVASARAFTRSRSRTAVLTLGSVTVLVAGAWGGALALIPAPGGADWGTRTVLQPTDTGVATVWPIPGVNAGLMMPVVAPDGTVWVAEMNVNRLAGLDPATRTLRELTFAAPIHSTMGIALDRSGIIWLAQEAPNALGRFDPASGAYREIHLPTPGASPSGIAIDAAGGIWFTELGADRIGRYDPGSGRFSEYPLTKGSIPFWLAIGPDGRVWFTELQGDRVGVVTPSSGSVRELPTPDGETPTGIAVDRSGTVWFVTSEGLLVRLDPVSLQMTTRRLPMGIDYGLAVAPGGTIWIGSATDTVAAFDPTTDRFTTYRFAPDSGPWWPAIAPDGSVWVALSSQQGNGLARILGR